MISDLLLGMLVFVMESVRALFPDGAPLAFVLDSSDGAAVWIGEHLGPFDKWIPVHEAAYVTALELSIVAPAVLAYHVANWIWRHIPVVGGG